MNENENEEQWKDIHGFEGKYQVSSLGRIKSVDRILPHKTHGTWHIKERILRPAWRGPAGARYLGVSLHNGNGIMTSLRVHRIVAETFIPNPANLPQVNHIDGDKSNNKVDNLEWVTEKQNTDHAWKTGLCENIVKAKRIPIINMDTGERYNSIADAERAYGGSYGTISHALNGKHERAHGYHWKYAAEVE